MISQFLDKDKDKDKDSDSDKNKKTGAKSASDESSDKIAAGKSAIKDWAAKKSDAKSGPKAAPVFTVVRAPDLIYDQDTRIANYQGGATLVASGFDRGGEKHPRVFEGLELGFRIRRSTKRSLMAT